MNPTRTTTQLLDDLHDPRNELAWGYIDDRYRPVIIRFVQRFGLTADEAEDVAQQTLSEFVHAYREGRYQRTRGRLSSWILGIAHNTSRSTLRQRRRNTAADISDLPEQPDEDTLRQYWSEERDREIFLQALNQLRNDDAIEDRTFLAFELVAVRGIPAAEAARAASMTVEQVYVVKSRMTKRLRTIVQSLTAAFEDDR